MIITDRYFCHFLKQKVFNFQFELIKYLYLQIIQFQQKNCQIKLQSSLAITFHNNFLLFTMLSFLQNRKDEARVSITGIHRKPHITYGMSVESPAQFVKNHTNISLDTYANPHLKYQQLRLSKMSLNQKSRLSGDWTKKTNMNLVEEEKVINKDQNSSHRTLYHDMYHQELNKRSSRFRLTKGQFTSFINNQMKNQALGPLQGQERSLERARETKKTIMQQSITSLQKLKSNPSLLSTFRISTIYNQKRKLRKNRQMFHNTIKNELQNRRFSKSPSFLLPKMIRRQSKKQKSPKKIQQSFQQNYLNMYFKTVDVKSRY